MKVLLVSELISTRPNEGTLVFLAHLENYLRGEGDLTIVHASGEGPAETRVLRIAAPKVLLSRALVRLLRSEPFDVIVYAPQSGLTAPGLMRAALLRLAAKRPVIVIGLQDRSIGAFHRIAGCFGGPDLALSPVARVRDGLARAGIESDFIMPGYDNRLFRPAESGAKRRLRGKYNLPLDRFICLHVGHIRESRNLEVFLRYRDWGNDVQPVIKAGEVDPSWAHRLRMAGIIVIDEYIEPVHELYQAADAYVFPVADSTGAVEFPLSVIEACACNLPVVATRFGILPEMLPEGGGLRYYDRVSQIPGHIASARLERPETAAKVVDFTWRMVFRRYLFPHLRAFSRERAREASA